MPVKSRSILTLLLYAVFFLSGAAALVFETLWFRQVGLVFGNSIWAGSLVLSAFMGGLALGNYLAARYGHRLTHPLRCYAALELAIAMTGIGLVLLLPVLNTLLTPLFRPMLDQPVLINAARLAIGFVLLLVPSASMGATLPILIKGLRANSENFGGVLGLLYGVNTLGAVAGVLIGEWQLIGLLGIRGTALAAGGVNVLAASIAWWIGQSWSAVEVQPPPREKLTASAKRLLAGAFLFGGILLALEVIWFRYMLLFTGGTSRTFAIMLAVVLVGIGLGGLFASFMIRCRPHVNLTSAIALLSGAAVVATHVAFACWLSSEYINDDKINMQRAMGLMLPVCILSGMLFPMLGQILQREVDSPIRSAGLLTLANTLGAMLGPLLAGFVLLPQLGLQQSIFILAMAYGVGAVVVLWGRVDKRSAVSTVTLVITCLLFIFAMAAFPRDLMRKEVFPKVVKRFTVDGSKLVEVHEGAVETVLYLKKEMFGEPYAYRQVSNGMAMSGTNTRGRRYMKMFAYLPIALHPSPRKVLLISYGIGVTAKALTDTSWIQQIDVVDISRDLLDSSAIAWPLPDKNPLDDPRVRVHIEDGRFFLLSTDQRYDLITGDPPSPKAAGIGNLYSKEFFQLVYDRLAPGGVCSYRLSVSQLSESEMRAIVRGFCEVFEDSSLWTASGMEWMLLGVREHQTQVTLQQFTRQWRDPVISPELRNLGFELPQQLPTFFIADKAMLDQLTYDVLPLVDNYPYRLSPIVDVKIDSAYMDLIDPNKAAYRVKTSEHIRRLFPPQVVEHSAPMFSFRLDIHDAMTIRRVSKRSLPHAAVHRVLSTSPLRTLPLWLLMADGDEVKAARKAVSRQDPSPTIPIVLGHHAISQRQFDEAAAYYAAARKMMPRNDWLIYDQMFALCMAGKRDKAQAMAAEFEPTRLDPHFREVWWRFAADKLGLKQPSNR